MRVLWGGLNSFHQACLSLFFLPASCFCFGPHCALRPLHFCFHILVAGT